MSDLSFQSLLRIVEEVESTPFDEIPNVDIYVVNVINQLVTESDVVAIANQLGVPVTDELRTTIFDEAIELMFNTPEFYSHLETCLRLKIILDQWLGSQ